MKTEIEIRAALARLKARQDADEPIDERSEGEPDSPDWTDTSNRITALEWVLGECDWLQGNDL